jgi:hypothetical protein
MWFRKRRFVFDDEALEIKIDGTESDNVVVGGRNRWPYASFMNWRLFFGDVLPVLVYYKVRRSRRWFALILLLHLQFNLIEVFAWQQL